MEAPLSTIAEKYQHLMKILKVSKEDPELFNLIERYKVQLIPAFLLFLKGEEITRIEGETTLEKLTKCIETSCKFTLGDRNKLVTGMTMTCVEE